MGISLPIGSHIDETEARKTTRQAEDYFSTAGRRAGDEFSRQVNQGLGKVDTSRSRAQAAALERAFDRAADAAGKLRTEEAKLEAVRASGTATDAQLIAHSERAERARRAEARAVREATNAVRDLQNAGRSSGGFMDNMGRSMDSLGTAARSFAMAGAPAAILAVGGAAITASGALAVLPAALSGVAAGVGTLVLGMQGFGDAMKDMGDPKKFAEDLQKLSPAAQQTALEFKNLVDGPLGELRKATQESLFSGMAKEFHDAANVMLPSVKAATTGIASAFNGMAHGSLDQLMKPETAGAFDATLRNITQAFTNLAPAAAPFTKAMTDIAQVGSSFLPTMSTAITNAATAFSQFISHAAETGQLANWIREGGDMLKQIGTLAWEFGRAIAALMPVAKDVFGYVSGALHETADLIREHPGLIWGVVGAFAAWKTIEGTAALITSLTTISTALRALPAVAATAGAGISAGLAGAAATISRITAGLGAAATVAARGGMPAFVPLPEDMTKSRSPQDVQAMIDDLTGKKPQSPGTPGIPGMSRSALDAIHGTDGSMPGSSWFGNLTPPATPGLGNVTAGLEPWAPSALPAVPADGGSKKQPLPTVAAAGQDPMSLLQGIAPTASLYSAAGSVLDNQQKVAQAKSDLNTLEKANVRDENAITAKRNELARAQREEHESELRLTEAKQQAVQKSLKGMQTASGELQQLGVQLDKDFGISKGLGGIVENAVKALGNILAAPFLQALGFVAKANPNEGSGLMGIAAANGIFGPQYTPSAIAASQAQPSGGYNPGGGYPVASSGGYASDAALLANVPAGHYSQTGNADLVKGLGDCSSAVEDLVNILDGRPTGGRSMATGNAAEWLTSHGFLPGMGGPGDFRVGYNSGHMQATLPGGTNFNWGSDASAQARGMDGSQGAYDPAFTSHYYRPAGGSPVPAPPPVSTLAPTGPVAPSLTPVPPSSGNILPQLTPADIQGLPFSMPGAPPASGGAPLHPGIGPGNALPGVAPLGPVMPAVGPGVPYASQGGNSGNIVGGLPMDGLMAAAGAADLMMPGAGAAAKIGIQVANRTIGYAAQNAGILANGLLETFSVGDNPKGSLGAGWAGKLAGGIAGAGMALPNIAGKKAPEQQQGQQQGGNVDNSQTTINVQSREGASGQEHGEQIAAEQGRMWSQPGSHG